MLNCLVETKIDLTKLWVVHELFQHFHFLYYHLFFYIFLLGYHLFNYSKDQVIYITKDLHHFLSLMSLSRMNLQIFLKFFLFFLSSMKLNCLMHLYKNSFHLTTKSVNLNNSFYYNLINLNIKLILLFFSRIQLKTKTILAHFNWQPYSSLF
jgi:hypothetical protein